jgi:hypothetical protein
MLKNNDTVFSSYVLPLIGINKESLPTSFETTLLDKNVRFIWVRVSNANSILYAKRNKYFDSVSELGDYVYYTFRVPDNFKEDIRLIAQGRYSKISELAKKTILNSLPVRVNPKTKGRIHTKAALALNRHPALIDMLMKKLDLSLEEVHECIINPNTELISRPEPEDFIEFYLTEEST